MYFNKLFFGINRKQVSLHGKSLIKHTIMVLSDLIKDRRVKLKLSQIDLSEMSGVSLATIKNIERGKGNPSIRTMEKILEVLGLELICRVRQTV